MREWSDCGFLHYQVPIGPIVNPLKGGKFITDRFVDFPNSNVHEFYSD